MNRIVPKDSPVNESDHEVNNEDENFFSLKEQKRIDEQICYFSNKSYKTIRLENKKFKETLKIVSPSLKPLDVMTGKLKQKVYSLYCLQNEIWDTACTPWGPPTPPNMKRLT